MSVVTFALAADMTTDTAFGELQYSRDKGTVQYDHRRYLCPEAVSAARPLTLKLPQAIWLSLDGTFAYCQQAVSRQSVPTDQLSVQYLYCNRQRKERAD